MTAPWTWLRRVRRVRRAWRSVIEFNPDARILGGPRSRELWAALDDLAP